MKPKRTRRFDFAAVITLKLLGFISPEKMSEQYESDTLVDKRERLKQRYGAEQVANRAAAVKVNGKTYIISMEMAEYDGKWFNTSLQGDLAALIGARNGIILLEETGFELDELIE